MEIDSSGPNIDVSFKPTTGSPYKIYRISDSDSPLTLYGNSRFNKGLYVADKVVEDQKVLKVPKVERVIQHKVVLDQQVITAKVLVVTLDQQDLQDQQGIKDQQPLQDQRVQKDL